eukprot:COSAG01_NODE_353_length_18421_cov_15.217716_7_plen_341_part_00
MAARGRLSSVLFLCKVLASKPPSRECLLALLPDLHTIFDVASFEPCTQDAFRPVPGSWAELVHLWRDRVFPSVHAAGGDKALEQLEAALHARDLHAACMVVRTTVSNGATFGALHMPKLDEIGRKASAQAYRNSFTKATALISDLEASVESPAPTIQAWLLGQVDLLAYLCRQDANEPVPVCVEPSAVQSLVHLLAKQALEPLLAGNSARSYAISSILHILRVNINHMSLTRELLSRDVAQQLHSCLTLYFSVDLERHPHCRPIVQACADLFSTAQNHILRSAEAQALAVMDLIDKIELSPLAPDGPSAFEPEPEPEYLKEPKCLRPIVFHRVHSKLSGP